MTAATGSPPRSCPPPVSNYRGNDVRLDFVGNRGGDPHGHATRSESFSFSARYEAIRRGRGW